MKRCLRAVERSVDSYLVVVVLFFVVELSMKLDKTMGCGVTDKGFHVLVFFPVVVGFTFPAKNKLINN